MAMGFRWITLLALVAVLVVIALVVASLASRGSKDGAPKGFPWIPLVFGIVVIAGIATFILSRSKPTAMVLDVNVPSGKGFIGEVMIDGRRELIDGTGSGHFEFTGKQIVWKVLVDDETGSDLIEVNLSGAIGGSISSYWGAEGRAESQILGAGGMFTSMNENDWRATMLRLRANDPEEADSVLPGTSAPSNPAGGNDADDSSPQEDSEPDASKNDLDQPTSTAPEETSVSFALARN